MSDSHSEFLSVLLEPSADVNACDENGKTPLVTAMENFDLREAQTLLEKGARVDLANGQGETPLHVICSNEMYSVVLEDQSVVSRSDFISLLLGEGADVDARDHLGNTPLMVALDYGHIEGAERLLEAVAHLDLANCKGETLLHVLCSNPSLHTTEFAELVLFLSNKGADVNARDCVGNTSLMTAIEKDYFRNARGILEAGARVDLANCKGETPLHLIWRADLDQRWNQSQRDDSCPDFISLLLSRGAD